MCLGAVGWTAFAGCGLEQKMAGPAAELARLADSWHVPSGLFWRQLIGMAADLPTITS